MQRIKLREELRPLLSLAIYSYLKERHGKTNTSDDRTATVELLARWNGYRLLPPSDVVVSPCGTGQIPLGQGLIAEASPFVAEHFTVLARPCTNSQNTKQQQQHPSFVEEDASWYRALETRVNDNLVRWEEQARKRRQQRLEGAQQWARRTLDSLQAPIAQIFGIINAVVAPVVDQVRQQVREVLPKSTSTGDEDTVLTGTIPPSEENARTDKESQEIESDAGAKDDVSDYLNVTDPEDLVIFTNDGSSLVLLSDVYPVHRLLSLPTVNTTQTSSSKSKTKPPYRLRMARGGLVITLSVIALGAIPPTYRSIRFMLEYPRTAEIMAITLIGSIAYNIWSWHYNARIRQEMLIASAVQSRLVARNQAALNFLIEGATQQLTDTVMREYVDRLLGFSDNTNELSAWLDPLVIDLGSHLGLFRMSQPNEVVAWEEARAELLKKLKA